jgi:hypothetical protein
VRLRVTAGRHPPATRSRRGAAHLLWSKLAQILFEDQQVTWQYHWTAGSLEITAWVPWTVSDETIGQLIGEAWPGAAALCFLPDEIPDGTVQARGGTVRPPRPRKRDDAARRAPDTLSGLCSAAASLGAGESAVVQILARPVAVASSPFRRGELRRARCRCPGDGCPRHGDVARGHHAGGTSAQPVWWNTTIQFLAMAAARPFATPSWEAIRMEVQNRAEGTRLHWLWMNMAAAVTGKRLRRPGSLDPLDDASNRRFRRGRLLSVPEIADLATLPPDPVLPGMNVESGSGNGTGTPL